jgi:hypothetical protein
MNEIANTLRMYAEDLHSATGYSAISAALSKGADEIDMWQARAALATQEAPSAQAMFNAGLRAAAEICKAEEAKLIGMKRLDVALGTSVCADIIQRLIGQPIHEDRVVQEKVPEGWKLVPIEPTEEMCAAGYKSLQRVDSTSAHYKAMLAAAPTADAERSE